MAPSPRFAAAAAAVLLLAVCAAPGWAEAVTPVEKVITLLEDLKAEVEGEGTAEASSYDDFACFCKTTTETKSSAITTGRDNIDTYSATISSKTAVKQAKETELQERKAKQEDLTQSLQETEARCAKQKAEYEAAAADLMKAISSLESAISAMEGSKPTSLVSIRESVERSLALADVMDLLPKPKRQAVSAFLQTAVDPADPTYQYHSQGIIDTLTQLLSDFRGEKQTLDDEFAKTEATCTATIDSLNEELQTNGEAINGLGTAIDTLSGEIAKAREDLVGAEAMLKDDQLYLKDLTTRCETRAKDWDQRSQLRAGEISALAGALELLKNNISGLDTEVNARALFLESSASGAAPRRAVAAPAVSRKAVLAAISKHSVGPALLQEQLSKAGSHGGGLLRGARAASAVALSMHARQDRAAALLRAEGQRLSSATLASLGARLASSDPFAKVKVLIQDLIERLLREATSEATKKGFCDEELGKAYKDRDFRLADSRKLDVEIQELHVTKDELEVEIQMLSEAVTKLKNDLNETTVQREQEHAENMDTIKKAQEGFAAVSQAIDILKVFYKRAAKASVLLQASPVDEDTAGAGFEGAYTGKQESSKGIIGMLEVIKSDFDRTSRVTEAAEKKAHAEFVDFDRASRADISGKEKKVELDEEDLETTVNTIDSKMSDLKAAQDLLDSALKAVEALKPTCIDTGMSFEDRVAKREEEIAALKRAVCILDTEGAEADC